MPCPSKRIYQNRVCRLLWQILNVLMLFMLDHTQIMLKHGKFSLEYPLIWLDSCSLEQEATLFLGCHIQIKESTLLLLPIL